MNPNTSKFFHIEALILGSDRVGGTVGAEVESAENESSASFEDGERREAQRLLKPAEKDGGSREKRRVWNLRVYAE